MTVPSTTVRSGPYYPNGITVAFPFGFRALEKDDVEVVRVPSSGTPVVVPDALYNVKLSGAGGSVVFSLAPSAGDPLYVQMSPSFLQEISLENEGAFLPEVITEALDRAAQRALSLRDMVTRAISVPFGEAGVFLPVAVARAGKFLGFDAAGNALAMSGTGADAALRADLANAAIGLDLAAFGGRTAKAKIAESISVYDTQYAGGAKGDGVTDDSAAITQAAAVASVLGRSLATYSGRFAVANARLPTAGALDPSYVTFIGDPVFVQAQPNVPCLIAQNTDGTKLQSVGHRINCTVIPHPASAKGNAANIAIDLTGFSATDIIVRLGTATAYTATTGRFNTVVGARSNSPFHYGNRIHLIMNAVPAPKYGIRYTNGGSGAAGNPNINQVSGYINALDTIPGDVIFDLGDSTQVRVTWPTLMEACPNATAVKAGNFSIISGVWFENMGQDIDFTGTTSTTPNNCHVKECQFSGGGHIISYSNNLGAPPNFEMCIGDDTNVSYRDQFGGAAPKPMSTRSRAQPAEPTISFTVGGGSVAKNNSATAHRLDHHGVTTFQLQYFVTPAAVGSAQMRLAPPAGFAVEQMVIGVRDGTTQAKLAWALGDNLAGTDFDWVWQTTNLHAINIRVTLRAV